MSDTAPQPSPALHGPGGLLATPGLAAPNRKRKWGLRLKAKQIVGNLYRSDTGKFQAGSGRSPAGATPQRGRQLSKQPKPTAKPIKAAPKPKGRAGGKGRAKPTPKPTPEQRQAERDAASAAKQTANRSAVSDALANADASLGPSGAKAVLAAADGGPIDKAMGAQLQTLGYAQQNPDGSYRLTSEARALASAANRGDTRQALDADGRAQERAKKAADTSAKKPATAAPDKKPTGPAGALDAIAGKLTKPAKPAASGGGSKKPAEQPDKAAERARRADATASQIGMAAPDLAALRSATETGGVQNDALSKLGLVGPDGLATDQGRRALTALERGDVRQYNAALQDAKSRMGREQGARDRQQAVEGRRSAAEQLRSRKRSQQIERIKRRAMAGGKLTQSQLDQATEAGALDASGRWKSFTVFKDHAGQPRWIARTTTAYRDRDDEIISEAALDEDSQRMMRTKQFGPLRYWHIGQPDPSNLEAPWGPGVDIGTCDYSVVIGRTRIESGTFHSAAIARKMAAVAHRHEMSPGFLHPIDAPDSDKVFHSIHTFERSPVPTRYGRGSNLFTGFTVKECRMELSEMERRFKAMYQELGLTPEQGLELGQNLIATEKAAAAQGIAFKSDRQPYTGDVLSAMGEPQPVYVAADGTQGMIIDGLFSPLSLALKAFPPKADEPTGDAPAIEAKADDPMEAIAEEVAPMDEEPSYDAIGDMTREEFSAFLSELLAPVLKMQDMVKSIGDAHAELKGMYGGAATKEAGVNAELAALKSQQAELASKIAQIEGDQPSVILPDDVAAALKSTGPAAPPDPDKVEVPDDPNRPFAQIAARTMPALYKNTPDGGFAGWAPPPST